MPTLKRMGALTHAPIDFYFHPTPRDFVVHEIPLYEASGKGEHLYLLVRKKNLSTFELLDIFSTYLGIKKNTIGYAGLKDKHALTTQTLSLPKACLESVERFEHPLVKILNINYHDNKLRIGHLKGNRFFMRLKKVDSLNAHKIESVLMQLQQNGIANYFGYQRFGHEGNNYEKANDLLDKKSIIRDKSKRQFLISALQSHLFNQWLAKRVEFSHLISSFHAHEIQALYPHLNLTDFKKQPHFFKILRGDVMVHFPYGKTFYAQNIAEESQRYHNQHIVPTGLLCGIKTQEALEDAALFEKDFIDSRILEKGSRRAAWVFVQDTQSQYLAQEAQMELHFSLPKGSYATVFLEQLAQREILSNI